jgi:hypothetical protein
MRHSWFLWLALGWLMCAALAEAATGRVIKVLPQFLDLEGRNSLSPSLYERDAYQARLRRDPSKVSGMCFQVQWKTKGKAWDPLKIRVELRGAAQGNLPRQLVLEETVQPGGWFSNWTKVMLKAEEFKKLGAVSSWRVTLWEGAQLLGEQKSFLW